MQLRPFALEEYFARYEFRVDHLLSASDCEALSMQELLDLALPPTRRLWDQLSLSYTETPGHPVLRAEIAALYSGMRPEDVLVAVPEEGIFVLMNALLQPGDHVIVLSPAYQSLYEVPQAIGCTVTRWDLALRTDNAGRMRWRLDLDALRGALTPQTRLIVVNFPHNPTGFLPTQAEFAAILDLAAQRGIYVFSDEMYRYLEHSAASLPSGCESYERAVTLSGLSKTFALPGLRLGWLATRDATLLGACTAFKAYTTICHSAPSEILGIIALQARQTIVARSLGVVLANLALTRAWFERRPAQFAWIEPQAGSVVFPRFLGDRPILDFCQGLLDRTNTMLLPGDIFEWPGNHFRLGLGRRDFPAALKRLEEYVGEVEDGDGER